MTFLRPLGLDPDTHIKDVLRLLDSPGDLILDSAHAPLPESFRDRARIQRIIKKNHASVDPRTRALLHGDTHAGSTYTLPDGQPRFLDFDHVMIGSALWDVSYAIACATNVAERRRDEMGHLDWYLECLLRAGGPSLARHEVMIEYKRGFLLGWGWLVRTELKGHMGRARMMSERFVAALEDHGVHELIEKMED